jgi:hypothetical protein
MCEWPRADTCEPLCLDVPRAEDLRRSRADTAALVNAAERAKTLADPTLVHSRREGKMVVYSLPPWAQHFSLPFPSR